MGRTILKVALETKFLTLKKKIRLDYYFEEDSTPFSVVHTDDYPDMGKKMAELEPGDQVVIQYYKFKLQNFIIDFHKINHGKTK